MASQSSYKSIELEESRLNDNAESFIPEIDDVEEADENTEIEKVKGIFSTQFKDGQHLTNLSKIINKDRYSQFKMQAQKDLEGEFLKVMESNREYSDKYSSGIVDGGGDKNVEFLIESDKIVQPFTDEEEEESVKKSLPDSAEQNPALLDLYDRCFSDKVMEFMSKREGRCDFMKASKKQIKGRKFEKVERKIENIPKPLKSLKIGKLKEELKEKLPVSHKSSIKTVFKMSDYYRKSGVSLEGRRTGKSSLHSRKDTSRRKSKVAASCNRCYKQSFNWKLRQINEIEERLKQHPLALYPHLEEYIPYTIFEEVTEILDPEMKKAFNEDNYVDPHRLDDFSEMFKFDPSAYGLEGEEEEVNKVDENVDSHKAKELLYKLQKGIPIEKVNPYKAIYLYDEREKKAILINRLSKAKYTSLDNRDDDSPVTKEFCEYLASLSQEEKSLVTEDDVHGFFSSGIETKPPLSVPIQFVAMEGIPLELRRLTGGPDAVEMMRERVGVCEGTRKKSSKLKSAKPKFRFGAWYLDPNEWKKLPYDEPLVDPKHSTANILETNIKDLELDHELATMHGTKLFLEFASRNKKRKPEFLKNVIRNLTEDKTVDDKSSIVYSIDRE